MGRAMDTNTAIAMTLGYNMGIGFVLTVDWFKPAVKNIVSTGLILRRGKGENVEGGNGSIPSMGWMGMDLVNERARIWKYNRNLSCRNIM